MPRLCRICATAFVVGLSGCSLPSHIPPPPPRNLEPVDATVDTGVLRGAVEEAVASFKNIPYAAPPVGDRRWRPPEPPAAWQGVRDASSFGNDCMQNRVSWDKANSAQPLSEDCLYLNVWTPSPLAKSGSLPVMVWIHGGAYGSGAGSSPVTVGNRLAARGVVVVTLNYRLGRYGFFAHPALSAESRDAGTPTGNFGFMDQIAALKWVQRNIRVFGGDPGNVTIFGESAGADSVLRLMLGPMSRGLFAKAISESGPGRIDLPRLSEDLTDLPSAEKRGVAFARSVGIKDGSLSALRALPASKVLGGISLVESEKDTWSGAMIDGRIVTTDLAAGFAAGLQAPVPLIIGTNSDEFGAIPWIWRGPMTKSLYPRLGGAVPQVVAAYGSQDAFDASFVSDFIFVEPARFMAAKASPRQPVYLYRFNYVAESKRKDLKGAPHASEVAYIFDHLETTGDKTSDTDRAEARKMGDFWTAFARSGVPRVAGDPEWVPYNRSQDLLYEFSGGGNAMRRAGAPWLEAITRFVEDPAPVQAQR